MVYVCICDACIFFANNGSSCQQGTLDFGGVLGVVNGWHLRLDHAGDSMVEPEARGETT